MKQKSRGMKIIAAMMALLVFGACAVHEKTQSGDRRSSLRKTASAQQEGAAYAQEGIAGVRAVAAGSVSGNVPPELSASHKTLPLNLMVSVRNKENGRSVIVRVSERGPLVRGRMLDLSPLAAKRLGIEANGAALVRLEALGFGAGSAAGRGAYQRPANYDAGVFSVQIMVFTDAAQARTLAEKMRRLFNHAEVRATTEGGRRFYRVFAGKYGSLKDAEAAKRNFSEHGYPASFVLALD